jgi:hypothetical protein
LYSGFCGSPESKPAWRFVVEFFHLCIAEFFSALQIAWVAFAAIDVELDARIEVAMKYSICSGGSHLGDGFFQAKS